MNEQLISHETDELVNLHDVAALQSVAVREGVTLRPMQDEDAEALLAILEADPGIRERVAVAAKMMDEESVRAEVEDYQADTGLIRYVVEEDNKVTGLVSLWRDEGYFGQQPRPHAYGFGYFQHPDFRGRGVVSDSVRALMDTAQENFRVDSFIAFCEEDNAPSIAVLEKLGFESNGIAYDVPGHGWIECMYEKKVA